MSSTLYLTSTCAGPAAFTRRNSPNMAPKGMWKVCWITFYPGSIAPFYSKAQPVPGAKHHVSQLFPKPSTASAWGLPRDQQTFLMELCPTCKAQGTPGSVLPASSTPSKRDSWGKAALTFIPMAPRFIWHQTKPDISSLAFHFSFKRKAIGPGMPRSLK